jgi:uncharacterized protein (DUF362 family)/ferredoxin
LQRVEISDARVDIHQAQTSKEASAVVEQILTDFADILPSDLNCRVVIKPNLNNDLVALTGNCTDLRILCPLIEGLQTRGYTNITLCDGSNVGIARRDIDTFKRLRVAALQERYGITLVDLNHTPGRRMPLHAGANPEVASIILDAEFLINVPKIKTHCEAGMSCACKNWVGINRGQDKRHMHYDLGKNIAQIAMEVPPDLIIVDGLVGMEGNGPGDGDPIKLGLIIGSNNPFINDLVVAHTISFPWEEINYLKYGLEFGAFTAADIAAVEQVVVPQYTMVRPPPRSILAVLSERRELEWLKLAVRPLIAIPAVTKLAYDAKIIQDVYTLEDDTITSVQRSPEADCGTCTRCADVCPTHLDVQDIGVKTTAPDCINCLYCWFVCPDDTITLVGELNHLERQVERYRSVIQTQ